MSNIPAPALRPPPAALAADAPPQASWLVIGLGNPILGDDGVGWQVAEAVQAELAAHPRPGVEVAFAALGGLSLMERLVGYDRALIIDAITLGEPPGTVRCFWLDDMPGLASTHLASAHDTTLPTALALGKQMGAALPEVVQVVGVEAERLFDFSETLTPAVAAAVPEAARLVIEILANPAEEVCTYGIP